MRRQARALVYVGPLVLWMGIIFWASTPAGATGHSLALLERLIAHLAPEVTVTRRGLEIADFIVRKQAHLLEYAVFALLALRAIQFGRRRLSAWSWVGTLVLCALWAASDELHQRFVPGRTSAFADVEVDLVGVLLALLAAAAWHGVRRVEEALQGPGAAPCSAEVPMEAMEAAAVRQPGGP